jgi:hypothetical protein
MRVDYKTKWGENVSSSSLDNAWKGIRSLFGWAEEMLGMERPDRDLPRPETTSEEIQPFTLEEVKLLVEIPACTPKWSP